MPHQVPASLHIPDSLRHRSAPVSEPSLMVAYEWSTEVAGAPRAHHAAHVMLRHSITERLNLLWASGLRSFGRSGSGRGRSRKRGKLDWSWRKQQRPQLKLLGPLCVVARQRWQTEQPASSSSESSASERTSSKGRLGLMRLAARSRAASCLASISSLRSISSGSDSPCDQV